MPVAPKRSLAERGWRYTVVGLLCALGNYGVLVTVDLLGGHYLLGMLLGFLLIAPPGYMLHSWFTFAEPLSLRAFVRFSGSLLASYPIATAIMVTLCSGLRLSVVTAVPVATAAMFLWNFAAAHWAILSQFDFVPGTLSKIRPRSNGESR